MWVSYLEIYNDYVYDLLERPPTGQRRRTALHLGLDRKGNSFVKGTSCASGRLRCRCTVSGAAVGLAKPAVGITISASPFDLRTGAGGGVCRVQIVWPRPMKFENQRYHCV